MTRTYRVKHPQAVQKAVHFRPIPGRPPPPLALPLTPTWPPSFPPGRRCRKPSRRRSWRWSRPVAKKSRANTAKHSVDAKGERPVGQPSWPTQNEQGRFAFACTFTRTAAGVGHGQSGATCGNCAWPMPGDITGGRWQEHAGPLDARTPRPVPARPTPGRTDRAAGCAAGPIPRFGVAPRRRQRTSPAACARPGV